MVQIKKVRGQVKKTKHEPLHHQIKRDYQLPERDQPHPDRMECESGQSEQKEADSILDAKTSQKILAQSRRQLEAEGNFSQSSDSEEYLSDLPAEEYEEEPELSPQDLALLEAFEARNAGPNRNAGGLAGEILQNLNQSSVPAVEKSTLNPRIQEAFQKVGLLLSRYRSGKLPKAFKVIPALPNWEQVLALTEPASWSPQALFQGARIFCSNLKANRAQKFLQTVMLPRFVAELTEASTTDKRLNVHTFQALKKSTYKPAAFYKGLVFPLLERTSPKCTLREANAISAVLKTASIPALHSAAAILRLVDVPEPIKVWTGAKAIVLRTLLDKKYALPIRVIDSLVKYFAKFDVPSRLEEALPVLWHQTLLVFVQRFKQELSQEQKAQLMHLVQQRGHYQIGAEIKRELEATLAEEREGNSMQC
jgi:essential nuclear protein 1